MPKLMPGDRAPDLTLTAIGGGSAELSQSWSDGPALITFYRGDFCPMCNRYLRELEERYSDFEAIGVQIVAISADRPEVGSETARRHDLSFLVLSDPERQAIDAYDVIYNEAEGHAEPAVFVVSAEGRIAYEAIVSGALGRPSVDDVLAIVQRVSNVAAPSAP